MGFNEPKYILQNLASVFPGEGNSFIEDYLRGYQAYNAHFSLKTRKPPYTKLGDYCTVFNWPARIILSGNNLVGTKDVGLGFNKSMWIAKQMQSAVLVDIGEFVQYPERMREGLLPCDVRLQFLDDCLSKWLNETDFVETASDRGPPFVFSLLDFGTKRAALFKDGELSGHQILGTRCTLQGKLINDVVERRAN